VNVKAKIAESVERMAHKASLIKTSLGASR
jgi:hypothetical protein